MKCRRTRLNSGVSYSEKDFICRKTHDKKKQEVKPKISGEKNVSTKIFRVFRIGFSGFVLVHEFNKVHARTRSVFYGLLFDVSWGKVKACVEEC